MFRREPIGQLLSLQGVTYSQRVDTRVRIGGPLVGTCTRVGAC